MSGTPQARMNRFVNMFLEADTYDLRHAAVLGMSLLPDRENIEITLNPLKIARFYLKMQAFGFMHGIRNPNCSCMEDTPTHVTDVENHNDRGSLTERPTEAQ